VLLALGALIIASPPFVEALREAVFDGYQRLWPRERESAPATIVEIDEATLSQIGQWPWPRTQLAQLIERIAAAQPAVIGLDLLLPERDRLSPAAMEKLLPELPPELSDRLRRLPSNDERLARVLSGKKVVIAVAGLEAPDPRYPGPPAAAPVRIATGTEPTLRKYAARLSSIDEIARAAAGQGLISADPSQGVVRRIPLLATVSGTVVPALALEMLRVATGIPEFGLRRAAGGLLELSLGDVAVPLQRDGSFWLRYGPHDPSRFVSAAVVLQGKANPELFQRRLVLVGVTGLGLLDFQATPLGERMPGVELHAQVLEQIFDRAFLVRPAWFQGLEAAFLAAGILLLMAVVPKRSVVASSLAFAALLAGLAAAGVSAFAGGLLLDPAWPAIGVTLAFATLLAATLAEAERQRRVLREAAARAAGELAAARRIQMGLLPDLAALERSTSQLDVAALLEPARSVGGDFYDCVKLDLARIFFVVGDVSGKGMPAALFMALSKAILRAAAARTGADVGAAMMRAGAEIARENPEQLFVTAFAGILDLRTGMLEYCNAGHEPPYLLGPAGTLERFPIAGGPPLCTLADHAYITEYRQLGADDGLCVLSDGVTEAMNRRLQLYGATRLERVLSSAPPDTPAAAVVAAVHQDLQRFVGDAAASDDVTLLVLRWAGYAEGGEEDSADADLDTPVAGLLDAVGGRN
jgi:adenylate cyclase